MQANQDAQQEKSQGQLLQEKLLLKRKNSGEVCSPEQYEEARVFCEGYKDFLTRCKTEREAVEYLLEAVTQAGYAAYEPGKRYKAGDRVYQNNRGKALILATIGQDAMEDGVKILASHIDSPRLDLKPSPLYEEGQLALFKTHYYGGIKKYQWGALPLALHGVIVKKDGEVLKVTLGEDISDPVFCVTDLLPHLAQEQMKRPLREGLKGEELNILVGCRPFKDDKASEKVKLAILELLWSKYGITEHDFLSAELSAVPAFNARDVGLDASMIGSYGHDDRVCAYTGFRAAIEAKAQQKTVVTVFADKEETGSDGNSGLNSRYLEYFIHDLAAMYGKEGRHVLSRSSCFSADVNAAFDPTFGDVLEKRNCAYLNYGVVITQYTGHGGKYGTSQASAEFMAWVRRILDDEKIQWQTGNLGKVDMGGGGTVAKYVAKLNVDVVDVGVPVLSMHSPFEIVSKLDVYSTYQAFAAYIRA